MNINACVLKINIWECNWHVLKNDHENFLNEYAKLKKELEIIKNKNILASNESEKILALTHTVVCL